MHQGYPHGVFIIFNGAIARHVFVVFGECSLRDLCRMCVLNAERSYCCGLSYYKQEVKRKKNPTTYDFLQRKFNFMSEENLLWFGTHLSLIGNVFQML